MPFLRISPVAILLAGAAMPVQAQVDDTHAARVSNRVLAALLETNGVPGIAVSVWRDGRIVWSGTAGYRDVERGLPVDGNTVFRFASVSKVFAAVGAARLREQGRLDVDAPLSLGVAGLNPSWPAFTARQLAAHIAGLPHYQSPIDDEIDSRPAVDMRAAVARVVPRALSTAPGTTYRYSTHGYTLLSALVEARAGRPYLDYLAAEIVPGLRIGPDATASGNADASRAYQFDGTRVREARRRDFSYSWGGAGLGGTASDLATFGGRLLTGQIVSRETLEWMLQPARLNDGTIPGDDGYQLGFGLRVQRDEDGQRLAHHSGVTDGARSALVLYPDSATAVSVLSNALWVSSIERSARTLSAPFRLAPAGLAERTCPTRATRYTGTFGDQPIEGTARFRVEQGLCVGEISVGGAFATWLNAPAQPDAATARLIGMDRGGGFSRAALVTPLGAYELRATSDPNGYRAPLSEQRSLTIRLDSAGG